MPTAEQVPSRSLVPGLLLGTFLTLIIVGVAVWAFTGIGLLHMMGMFKDGRARINVDAPTVVRQIQQLQRLETVGYTMDKIITAERDNQYLPKFLAGDRLLLFAHGEVIAGVNLAALQPGDVVVHGQTITIRLPHAELFNTTLNNQKTRVYSRETGLFSIPDPNLETEVRQEAERQLQQAALQDGILKSADQNARNTMSALLKGFGFVQIEFQP